MQKLSRPSESACELATVQNALRAFFATRPFCQHFTVYNASRLARASGTLGATEASTAPTTWRPLTARGQRSYVGTTNGNLSDAATGSDPDWSSELTAQQRSQRDTRVVVVGAGPAGSAAAYVLAQRGFQVDVYEKRPEPNQDQVDSRRSYIIALSQRGVNALERVGIKIQQQEDARYLGTVTQRFKGRKRVSQADPGSVCFDRLELAQLLINEVRRKAAGRVRYHFQWSCDDVHLESKTAVFGSPDGESVPVNFDLLVAADGVNSAVRHSLESQLPRFKASVEDSGREYKTFRGLHADMEPPEFKGKKGRSIHLFLSNNSLTSLSCRRNQDGSYSGTFALKNGEFEDLESANDYEQLIKKSIRGIPAHWPAEIAKQCLYAPTSSNGKRVRCSEIHGPGVILLGDSAHAVTPIGGQGCNAALEDAAVLGSVLDQNGNDLSKLPAKWTEARLADVRSLVNIESSFYKLVGGRKLGVLDPAFLRLIAHLAVGFLLHKLLPKRFKPAALTQLAAPLPYSEIERSVNRDATAVLLLLLAAVAFGLLKAFHIL